MDRGNQGRPPLGRTVAHSRHYNPDHLYSISRETGRREAGIDVDACPFGGLDLWHLFELSWLLPDGKPQIAMAQLRVPADSPCLIESKSLKLYLNSLNMTVFEETKEVRNVLINDLSKAAGQAVAVQLMLPEDFKKAQFCELPGACIDHLAVKGLPAKISPGQLRTVGPPVTESLFSRLFRSVCPVTGQPDWATVGITYTGERIDPRGLLAYLISYREHAGFHESCVERIFCDLRTHCRPRKLTVVARFTRRGGIDITPLRSSERLIAFPEGRDVRQ